MLMVNNLKFTTPTNNAQNIQKQSAPRLSALKQNDADSVSFQANEKLFITKLRELCKRDWNAHLVESVEGFAHDVDPKHPDIVKEFEDMKKNPNIGKGLKAWIFEDLPKEMGIGGNKRL